MKGHDLHTPLYSRILRIWREMRLPQGYFGGVNALLWRGEGWFKEQAMRQVIPLSRRRYDYFFIGFFIINILFITYIVDLEQLVIPDPDNFEYPLWPPGFFVDLIHNYGRTVDPVLLARPVWWKMTLVIDSIFFGPFYIAALYAFIKGKEWIRVPCFLYSGLLFANVTIIMGEEIWGPHATPNLPLVFLLNLSWWLVPILLTYRMWRSIYPFTETAMR